MADSLVHPYFGLGVIEFFFRPHSFRRFGLNIEILNIRRVPLSAVLLFPRGWRGGMIVRMDAPTADVDRLTFSKEISSGVRDSGGGGTFVTMTGCKIGGVPNFAHEAGVRLNCAALSISYQISLFFT